MTYVKLEGRKKKNDTFSSFVFYLVSPLARVAVKERSSKHRGTVFLYVPAPVLRVGAGVRLSLWGLVSGLGGCTDGPAQTRKHMAVLGLCVRDVAFPFVLQPLT